MNAPSDVLTVAVQIPKGSRNKYEMDLLDEIEHFFQVYKDLEGHKVTTDGCEDRANAVKVLAEAFERQAAT